MNPNRYARTSYYPERRRKAMRSTFRIVKVNGKPASVQTMRWLY